MGHPGCEPAHHHHLFGLDHGLLHPPTFRNVLTGAEGPGLTLQFERLNHVGAERLWEIVLEATVEIDQRRYTFETRCMKAPVSVVPTILRVHRPARMTVTDRRRSPRRHLRGRTEVSVSGSDEHVSWCAEAVMLNLSTEGMACRLAEPDARRLAIGQTLGVAFRLGAINTPFDLNARVSNTTEAGTPGQVVVGLAFIADERLESNRTRLQRALKDAE